MREWKSMSCEIPPVNKKLSLLVYAGYVNETEHYFECTGKKLLSGGWLITTDETSYYLDDCDINNEYNEVVVAWQYL